MEPRKNISARVEKKKQETNAAHSLHDQVPAERRLKRECFLISVRPADFPAKVIRCSEWQHRQNLLSHNCSVNLDKSLAREHTNPRTAWIFLNRLSTGVSCSKEQHEIWKYFNGDTTCECGEAPETTTHMLQCPLLAHSCTLDNLQKFNENDRKCVEKMEECGLQTQKKTNFRLQTTQPTSGGAVTADSSCCANCVEPPRPLQWGPDLPCFGHAGHADPLDDRSCFSQKRVMSRPIQVRQLYTNKSGFVTSTINKYMS